MEMERINNRHRLTFEKGKVGPIKGLLAIVIILDHLSFSLQASVLDVFRVLGPPAVSLFLAFSAYGLYKSYLQKGAAYLKGFFKKRIWKVLLPALLATLLYYLILWNPNRSLLLDFRNTFMHGSPPLPQLWFVIEIIAFYLFFWVSFTLFGEKGIIGLVLGALLIFAWTYSAGFGRNWWITVLAFPTGAFVSKYERPLFAFCERSIIHWIAIEIVLGLFFVLLYLSGQPLLWTLCYVVIPVAGILFVAGLPRRIVDNRFLIFCGAISYELYLCHQIPIELYKVSRLAIVADLPYALAVIATSFVLAFLLHKFVSALSRHSIRRTAGVMPSS